MLTLEAHLYQIVSWTRLWGFLESPAMNQMLLPIGPQRNSESSLLHSPLNFSSFHVLHLHAHLYMFMYRKGSLLHFPLTCLECKTLKLWTEKRNVKRFSNPLLGFLPSLPALLSPHAVFWRNSFMPGWTFTWLKLGTHLPITHLLRKRW